MVFISLSINIFTLDYDQLNTIFFVNETKSEILYIFLSPADSDYWGPELLGAKRKLAAGEEEGYFIHYPDSCNAFDILIVDVYGDTYTIWDFEVCDKAEARVVINKKVLNKDFEVPDFIEFEIINETENDMLSVFISPADSLMLGVDFLDYETSIKEYEAFTVLVPVQDTEIEYDIYGIDEYGNVYSFRYSLDDYDDSVSIEPSDYDPDI